MVAEEKHKINVWIDESIWKRIGSYGYESPTEATKAAFQALILMEENGNLQEDIGSLKEEIGRAQEEVRKYQEDNRKLQEMLKNAPDLVTFSKLQDRHEGLQEIIREKDRSIERLENDLKRADQREDDLKQMHNNYMLQVQSLINQKAIGSPTKGHQTERKTTQKEERGEPEESRREDNVEQGENDLITKSCKYCGTTFQTDNPKREYCENKCRTAFNRKNKKMNEGSL